MTMNPISRLPLVSQRNPVAGWGSGSVGVGISQRFGRGLSVAGAALMALSILATQAPVASAAPASLTVGANPVTIEQGKSTQDEPVSWKTNNGHTGILRAAVDNGQPTMIGQGQS